MSDFTLAEAEDLIYREARLLDQGRYAEWLQLYTGDATYWIPSWLSESEPARDPHKEVSLMYLDRNGIEMYVKRIQTGEAHTFNPASRMTRVISNMLLDADGGEKTISAKWILHLYRARSLDTFSGDVEYRLRRGDDGTLRIFGKRVTIINDWLEHGQLIII